MGQVAEGDREGPDAHAALALVAAFAKATREELLGFPPRPPADLPADLLPEVRKRGCHLWSCGPAYAAQFFNAVSGRVRMSQYDACPSMMPGLLLTAGSAYLRCSLWRVAALEAAN